MRHVRARDARRGRTFCECQVLDSFALIPKIDGLGALYRFRPPAINMCFPPLVWQTYDVQFTAPRWNADGTKARNATITSWVNGVKVQDNVSLPNKTGAGKIEEPLLLPTRFQNHGDPVRFRNIWVVDRGLATGEFPQTPTKEQVQSAIKSEQLKRKERAKVARKQAAEKKRAAEKLKAKLDSAKLDSAKLDSAKSKVDDTPKTSSELEQKGPAKQPDKSQSQKSKPKKTGAEKKTDKKVPPQANSKPVQKQQVKKTGEKPDS